ncbi:MAG TPA: polysaccharide deacetylase family protein [Gemmatimonadaceae bacterium]|nr:polysaccharide deacetylase family protein [Gemmatimonadaceae bacterium]
MTMWDVLDRAFGVGGVVAYHGVGDAPHLPAMHISPARLREQLAYLRDRYSIVPLRELVRRWRNLAPTGGCVAITFDDAYAGVLQYALPIIRDLDLPATVFVTSRHAQTGCRFWWDDVELDRLANGDGDWSEIPATVGLPPLVADQTGSDYIRAAVIRDYAGRWPDQINARRETPWRSMDFDELTQLARDPRIDFGVHTVSHPALPRLSYWDQVKEIRENFELLRARLPRVQPVIAYPYGLYDSNTVRAAGEAGLIAGLSMEGRASADQPDPMTVPRVGGGEVRSPQSMARRLNRGLRPALILRNRGRHPQIPAERKLSSLPVRGPSSVLS